ncbi:hypothetical protein [Viridibacterium curvum]|uniref:Uncharacterized protein n=1 Tax=Viridibacterium curvum TaxID=1101404 RepID=A0ABP9QIS4_9RHOO
MSKNWQSTLACLAIMSLPLSTQAADVGVSVRIGQPGFYGRIDIGGAPPPVLIMPEPLIIRRPPPNVRYAPIYLRVPPGHEKHWDKHCRRYNACGRPVYFVRDDWYEDTYVPHYRERHGPSGADNDRGPGKGHGRSHGKHGRD